MQSTVDSKVPTRIEETLSFGSCYLLQAKQNVEQSNRFNISFESSKRRHHIIVCVFQIIVSMAIRDGCEQQQVSGKLCLLGSREFDASVDDVPL